MSFTIFSSQLSLLHSFDMSKLATGIHLQGTKGLSARSVWWDCDDADTIIVSLSTDM
jgi:hypothetical protein